MSVSVHAVPPLSLTLIHKLLASCNEITTVVITCVKQQLQSTTKRNLSRVYTTCSRLRKQYNSIIESIVDVLFA